MGAPALILAMLLALLLLVAQVGPGDTPVRGSAHTIVGLPDQDYLCRQGDALLIVCHHRRTAGIPNPTRQLVVARATFKALHAEDSRFRRVKRPGVVIVVYPYRKFLDQIAADDPGIVLAFSHKNTERTHWIIATYQPIPDEVLIHELMHYVIASVAPKAAPANPKLAEEATQALTMLVRSSAVYQEEMREHL